MDPNALISSLLITDNVYVSDIFKSAAKPRRGSTAKRVRGDGGAKIEPWPWVYVQINRNEKQYGSQRLTG